MAPRKAIPPSLLTRAQRGELTRSNTAKGTAERRAVDHVSYLRRRASRPGLSAREALGHEVESARPKVATFYAADPVQFVTVEGVTGSEMRRAGIYMNEVRLLLESRRRGDEWRTDAKAFQQRFARWKPIAGRSLLADPEAVVALAEETRAAESQVIFDSGRSRPGRRRRR